MKVNGDIFQDTQLHTIDWTTFTARIMQWKGVGTDGWRVKTADEHWPLLRVINAD